MLNTFKENISLAKFFQDGANFKVQNKSDLISYSEFVKYFSVVTEIKTHELVIGINFTYGWMPTIFDFRSKSFDEAVYILNEAKNGIRPSINNLALLKNLFNNSLVGTSKLLHFINPEIFAIWDSRVYRYLTGKEPHDYRVGNFNAYLAYLDFCQYLIEQKEFVSLKNLIEKEVGYSMTAFRVAELIMYSNGIKNAR